MQGTKKESESCTCSENHLITWYGKACHWRKEGMELGKILTPTQFIREAALKTGTVVTPTPWKPRKPGKKIRKSEMNQVQVGDFGSNSSMVDSNPGVRLQPARVYRFKFLYGR